MRAKRRQYSRPSANDGACEGIAYSEGRLFQTDDCEETGWGALRVRVANDQFHLRLAQSSVPGNNGSFDIAVPVQHVAEDLL